MAETSPDHGHRTHEVVCAELSLDNVTDAEPFPVLIGGRLEDGGYPTLSSFLKQA